MELTLNVVFVSLLSYSFCVSNIVCIEEISTETTNYEISKFSKQNAAGKTRHVLSLLGTLVSLNVQNNRQKNLNGDGSREDDTAIQIAVHEPQIVDVLSNHLLSNTSLPEGRDKKDEQDTIVEVYIDGDISSQNPKGAGKTSAKIKTGPQVDSDTVLVTPDYSVNLDSDTKRQKRSPGWIYHHTRRPGRYGRRTWKRYRDFWNWYLPYKNTFDPLASNIIG